MARGDQVSSQGVVEKRICNICKVEKGRSEYQADRRAGGGIRLECRACRNARLKEQRWKAGAYRRKVRRKAAKARAEARAEAAQAVAEEKARKDAERAEGARRARGKEARPGWRTCQLCGEEKEESRYDPTPRSFGSGVRKICKTCRDRWRRRYGARGRRMAERARRFKQRRRERAWVEAEWAEERELWQKLGEWGQLQL